MKLLKYIINFEKKDKHRIFTILGIKIKYLDLKAFIELILKDIIKQQIVELNIDERLTSIEHNCFNNRSILEEIVKTQILNHHDLFIKDNNIKLVSTTNYAKNSNDNIFPESTLDGVLRKPRFSKKIIDIYGDRASLLDIGCGAGGIVYDALMAGITAFGIDGSTANKDLQNGYWPILPKNLLTCDATQPFHFTSNDSIFKFKVISSWECLEHISEENIKGFLDNVYANLDNDGYFIGSISRLPYEHNGIVYHVTLKDTEWWIQKFEDSNFEWLDIENTDFKYSDFCRGIGMGWQDLHTNYIKNKEDGILFVAKKKLSY